MYRSFKIKCIINLEKQYASHPESLLKNIKCHKKHTFKATTVLDLFSVALKTTP